MKITAMQPMWLPKESTAATHMTRFRKSIEAKYNVLLEDYSELYKWSIENISEFWDHLWDYCDIVSSVPYQTVVQHDVPMNKIPKWFQGAKLNFTENILAKRWKNNDDDIAIFGCFESGTNKVLTDAQLQENVRMCIRALSSLGVRAGDVVAGFLPNVIETVIIFLSCAAIGAIWTCASPDFGVQGVVERFSQVNPKLIFSVDSVVYNGRRHEHNEKLTEVVEKLKSMPDSKLDRVVVLYADEQTESIGKRQYMSWTEFLAWDDGDDIVFIQLPFDHPLMIVYSSGTTGLPKCIVHTAGGTLIQHMKEHIVHGNVGPQDVFLYYTTTGWMMWNWLVSALVTGCSIVLYDGSPFQPDGRRLFQLVDSLGITIFGTSARYLQTLREKSIRPRDFARLTTLRMILSTGSVLSPETFDFVYEYIKEDVLLGSITGGTDIVSLFAGHNTDLPVYRGKLQCICLGMSVESWNECGQRIADTPGDLVCTKPFPVMPLCFWSDESGEKYRKAYFGKFPEVWTHGDYVSISNDGSVVMLGRSDGTLNPGGVRFGSAEIYNLMERFAAVEDSLVVGQQHDASKDERVILFCKLKPGYSLKDSLVNEIKTVIRHQLSPRHVPSVIMAIPEIPYTINGKKVEIAVKKILSGEKVVPSGTLVNPACLDLYYGLMVEKVVSSATLVNPACTMVLSE